MSSFIVIALTSFIVSGVTLLSGFGLGTILMPVFAIFFPLETAIAATAAVHLANNLIKAIMVGKFANLIITLKFTLPAILFAFLGAWTLSKISTETIFNYSILNKTFNITFIKITVATLMLFFSLFELNKKLSKKSFDAKYIPLGGALSGFFGGLSGHQGAFRSTFLLKSGLSKESFIGTTVLAAIFVDISRISIYGVTFLPKIKDSAIIDHIIVASIAAFLGVFLGSKVIKKVTYRSIQIVVGVMLLIISFALFLGLI
ncbi:sulfite exporter TauE/SafE family protein [bacterium]|nr:sulfite exporter TauE/SafE family protein [bacterium]